MTRRIGRRIFGAFLIIASLVVCCIPTDEVIAEDTKSTLSEFELNGTILVKYTGTAQVVSVPGAVTEIGEEAFADNTTMTSITLPGSLEKIAYAAFSGCNNLKTVIIPDSCESVGTAAFCNCTSLEGAQLGKNTKSLGTGVFTGCTKLSSISDNDYFKVKDGAVYDKDIVTLYEVLPNAKVKKDASSNDLVNMTTYKMPDTVKSIKPYAFYGCKHINKLEISPYLDEIPAYAFSYCNGLTSLKLPYSINTIDMKAFEYCINLEKVEMPVSVTYIHPTAFDGCPKLEIEAPADSYANSWYQSFDRRQVNIIDSEDNADATDASGNNIIDKESADKVKKIEGLIGETVIVGRQAVFFIDNQTVYGEDASEKAYAEMIAQMESVLQTETNGKGLNLPKFSIVDDKIADKAYYGDTSLKEYEFNDAVTSIGDFAFARTSLTNITIPEGVTHIGYGAFYHCDDLTTVLVPSTVTDIEPSAFANTRMMANFRLYGSSKYLIMGDGILVAYNGSDTSIEIPDGVKQIGPECFKDMNFIMEVSLPDSVTRICEDAFSGCVNLRSVTGGMNLSVIEDRAFKGCPINTVRIVDSVKEIGLGAFDFTGSSLQDAYKTVVFQGNNLPKSSYNKTTSRLSNSSFRRDSLEDVKVAIVNAEDVNRAGSVLDRDYSGFSGLICVINEPNTEYFNGTLRIIDCTLTKDEAVNFYVPSTVYVYGKGYNFDIEELNSVLMMAREGAYFADKETVPTVTFDGSMNPYVLNISKNEYVNPNIKEAYLRIYGDNVPGNLVTYDIGVREEDNEVLLTRFGKQKLPISISLPDNIPTTNLHVICLDEDNQLEDLPFKVETINDSLFVSFDITHTGVFGIYSFNSTAVSKYDLDDSPDTGDYIHPKWFLALGLFALGLVMLLLSDKSKKVV